MKFLHYLMYIGCLGGSIILARGEEKWYVYFVDQLKFILQHGSPANGLPKMDPIHINRTFSFENHLNRLNINLIGVLSNYSDFYINTLDVKPNLKTTIELQITSLNFKGSYNLDGQIIKAIPLEGSGDIEFFAGNVVLLLECKIHGKNRTINLSNFRFNYNVGVSRIDITGLLQHYHLDNIFEHLIGDLIPSGLNLLRHQIQKSIDQVAPKTANEWLKEMNPKRLIETIKKLLIPKI